MKPVNEIGFKFDKRDLWIGCYWDFSVTYYDYDGEGSNMWLLSIYICLLPCMVLYLKIRKGDPNSIR